MPRHTERSFGSTFRPINAFDRESASEEDTAYVTYKPTEPEIAHINAYKEVETGIEYTVYEN